MLPLPQAAHGYPDASRLPRRLTELGVLRPDLGLPLLGLWRGPPEISGMIPHSAPPRESGAYTIQVKSPQTNSIQLLEPGRFRFDVQVDASDRRRVTLPNGHEVNTTWP